MSLSLCLCVQISFFLRGHNSRCTSAKPLQSGLILTLLHLQRLYSKQCHVCSFWMDVNCRGNGKHLVFSYLSSTFYLSYHSPSSDLYHFSSLIWLFHSLLIGLTSCSTFLKCKYHHVSLLLKILLDPVISAVVLHLFASTLDEWVPCMVRTFSNTTPRIYTHCCIWWNIICQILTKMFIPNPNLCEFFGFHF